ncbi:MAG: hypothetical protein NW208_00060 [Bryobacter sp.]|nr:hypothetical protein [Bryobacter sp.]
MKFGVFLLAIGLLGAQEAGTRESLLRERVTEFWKAFEETKYRKADLLVREEDKDDFFSWHKKPIFKQEKSDVKFSEDGKFAQVMTPVETDEFMVGVGRMRIMRPILTHWKLEAGTWWWFQPKSSIVEGPFGKWDYGKKTGDGSGNAVPLTTALSRAPKFEDLQKLVTPNKTNVTFSLKNGGQDTIEFRNALPGRVSLLIDQPSREEFQVSVDPKEIPRDGTGVVTVKYTPIPNSTVVPLTAGIYDLRITVAQTGKTFTIQMKLE